MSEVKLESGTPEEVALKLFYEARIFQEVNSATEVLELYERCLKATKGHRLS